MRFLKALFAENSDISAMRVMSLISLCIGGYLAVKGQDNSVAIFVTAAFGGKFAQKIVETKVSKTETTKSEQPE